MQSNSGAMLNLLRFAAFTQRFHHDTSRGCDISRSATTCNLSDSAPIAGNGKGVKRKAGRKNRQAEWAVCYIPLDLP